MTPTDNDIQFDQSDSSTITLQDVVQVLLRRRRVIYLILLLALATAVALMLRPRKYTAKGVIRVQPSAASIYRTSPVDLMSGGQGDVEIASDVSIMQSRSIYLQVARELNLANNPAFWGTSHLKPRSLDDPRTREQVIRLMRKEIKVTNNPKNQLIHVSCTTISPALSAKMANTLINDYITDLFRMRYGSTERASRWLIGKLDNLKHQIERDQTEIIAFQKKLGIIGLDQQNSEYLQAQALDTITKAATEATVERILAEAKLRDLKRSNPNLMEGEVNVLSQGDAANTQSGLLQNLRNARAKAASKYAMLLAQSGPNYPAVRQQKAQLDEINNEVKTEQKRILNQARLSYSAARANEAMDDNLLQRKTQQAFSSGGDMTKYVLLLHDYKSHRSLYEKLVQRLREASITSGLDAGDIDIVNLADLPVLPNPPGPLLLLAGGLFAGLFLGCFAALAVDALDTRIANSEQAERAVGHPLLALVPHVLLGSNKKPSKSSAIDKSLPAPGSQYAEALQSLRTAVLLAQPGMAAKTILVSSAGPGEGKSTTARNLAVAFARHQKRVLLIDCDLRRGDQARWFDLSNIRGLTSVLTLQSSREESIQAVPAQEGLFLLSSGPTPPDPAVLIGSAQMAKIIEAAALAFDIVVVDAPPVLGMADAINLGSLVDAVILVVRERFSNRKAVRDTVDRIHRPRLPLIGFVLNDVDFNSFAYGYGYGYYYGKRYEGYFEKESK